jgi:DnaJ-class molecular chaperone
MGFFSQQTVQNCPKCIGKGYTTKPGYKLANKKQKFRRVLPYGIEDDNVLKMEGEGNLVYSKSKRKFRYSDLYVTTRYDIAETNKQLERKYGIKISNVHSGNIDYIYSANIFEFITGTQFNLPLPNGRILLIKISNLSAVKNIIGFGLPVSKTSYGNINIIFELKVLNPSGLLAISDADKLTLKHIVKSAYPKTQSSDAIVIDFN